MTQILRSRYFQLQTTVVIAETPNRWVVKNIPLGISRCGLVRKNWNNAATWLWKMFDDMFSHMRQLYTGSFKFQFRHNQYQHHHHHHHRRRRRRRRHHFIGKRIHERDRQTDRRTNGWTQWRHRSRWLKVAHQKCRQRRILEILKGGRQWPTRLTKPNPDSIPWTPFTFKPHHRQMANPYNGAR